MDTYPYSCAWKAAVDKTSDEWRAYCEALSLLKQYLQLEKHEGRSAATHHYKATLERMRRDVRSLPRVERLDKDFRLIGRYEAETLRPTI